MKLKLFILFACSALVVGCSSSQDEMNEANAEFTEEKTKTLQEYKECVDDADDEYELKKCEALLNAVKALETKSN
ncbi:hypothetical protein GCM10011369_34960 [Neiella marina]|uniref:EexN family lipoprotein n=1 Tax=Neiella marina TaxID=508461 RepID=A0A8J2XRN0_9GAMM|nr:hypothetical protein [Neiella marina]GGA89789.1 hypothetical protein GCM10011369_34960 [Neiella marina]